MSLNCYGSSSSTDEPDNALSRRPEKEKFFKEIGSFAYMFVDKLGETRSIPRVVDLDLLKSRNGLLHHTSRFHLNRDDNNCLVIRRGQPFHFRVNFDVPFDQETDVLQVCFNIGKRPMVSNGTEAVVAVTASYLIKSNTWGATIPEPKGKELTISVCSPSSCFVGIWSLEVRTMRKEDLHPNVVGPPIMNRYSSHSIYVLFNPWCKDDQVYMENDTWRQEYVMNDIGKIWRGVSSNFRPCVWSYGQYESKVLDACMVLLDWSHLRYANRGSPIDISRTISAMVNANDDKGILVGNWSGNYDDGTPPTDWQGSVQILQQWYDAGGEPVCYGQCWVFSGVTTTILRALGMPARSVTNFSSAHDTDASITIDMHFNEKGKHVKELDSDSVWNFHVWNDCWMMRPDLPTGYGGWQAIDATPQEMSEGKFRAGPASLVAVRRGEVGYQYDTAFIFAEVNADKVYWLHRGPDMPLQFIDLDHTAIGKFISARRPGPLYKGNVDRDDVTDQYKQVELSEEERTCVMNAVSKGQNESVRRIYQKQDVADVECLLTTKEEIYLGDSFPVQVKVLNTSAESRTVKTSLRVDTMQYTGVIIKRVAKKNEDTLLSAGEENTITMMVKADDYVSKLLDQGCLMISALLHVKETGQIYHAEDDFRVRFPEISVSVQGALKVGAASKVYASFQNPLDKYLSRAKFIFEGPGVENPTEVVVATVGKKKKAEASWKIKPTEPGDHTILVSFTSRELRDIDGSLSIFVASK